MYAHAVNHLNGIAENHYKSLKIANYEFKKKNYI